jgi:hypothetical protein
VPVVIPPLEHTSQKGSRRSVIGWASNFNVYCKAFCWGNSRECLGRHDSAQRTQGGRLFSAQEFKAEKTRYDMFPDMFCPKKSHIESLESGPPLPYVVCQYNIRWWWSAQPMNGESSSYPRLIGSMYLFWRTKSGYVGA